uniref:Uncharacterized protein n=1 Tax=Cercocebus atys TaxID=9531 RepID=A0A2K5KQE8_CERAT
MVLWCQGLFSISFLDSQLSSLRVISASRSLGQKTSFKNRKPEDSLTRLKR